VVKPSSRAAVALDAEGRARSYAALTGDLGVKRKDRNDDRIEYSDIDRPKTPPQRESSPTTLVDAGRLYRRPVCST
jgi:hypothetical protein